MHMMDKGMIHILSVMEQDSTRFYVATQQGTQFKTHELFIFGTSHLIFLDCGWPWETKTAESETIDKGETIVHN